MTYPDGTPHTSHTEAPVPFCVIHPSLKNKDFEIKQGEHALMDVCPTVLYTMGIELPKEFVGKPIFK